MEMADPSSQELHLCWIPYDSHGVYVSQTLAKARLTIRETVPIVVILQRIRVITADIKFGSAAESSRFPLFFGNLS